MFKEGLTQLPRLKIMRFGGQQAFPQLVEGLRAALFVIVRNPKVQYDAGELAAFVQLAIAIERIEDGVHLSHHQLKHVDLVVKYA